ncbi:type I-E CRISPR-associated protein Cse2/CasB [Actinosynnema sp. NPDC020468]|uniref:type I-E CRISPR-associated protein Cse2/CasB n=1 Tax=Actinosynnema sp. NPDC020468 TaxID=3154488 RepID=UPI0033D32281
MTTTSGPGYKPYWEDQVDGEGRWKNDKPPNGGDLAALRRGLGRQAGTVPQMWRFYRTYAEHPDAPALVAEHAALALYGLHQQSQRTPMHRKGVGLGEAMRRLKSSDGVNEDGVTRRFNAAATATSLDELVAHLRGLITLLRGKSIALDYTRLSKDLRMWTRSEGAASTRRYWGLQFYARPTDEPDRVDG